MFSDRITDPEDLVLTFESVGKVMRSTFKVGLREVISAAFEAEGKAEGKAEGEGESESGKKPDDGGEEKTVNPVTDSTGPLELIAQVRGHGGQVERLEQLRVLYLGHKIAMAIVNRESTGIDTPEQYARFVERYRAIEAGELTKSGSPRRA